MSAIPSRIGVSLSAGDWFPVLADVALKSFLILAAVWLVTALLRRASAATRHLVWLLAVVNLLCLPVFAALLPGWAALPRWMDVRALFPPQPSPDCAAEMRLPNAAHRGAPAAALPPGALSKWPLASAAADGSGVPRFRWNVQTCALTVWVGGTAFPLLTALLGAASLWRLGRRSRVLIDPDWSRLLAEASARVQFRRRVTLLTSGQRQMPMTWGLLRPKILLPEAALDWAADRRRNVLLHELAHVKRGDCLAHLVARLACAVYWFNPLVWVAARRMATERERACDDRVLCAGAKAAEYAEHLLEVTAGLAARGIAFRAAIAMARPSALEGRLLAILDEHRNRRAMSWLPALATTMLLCGLLLPLAMLRAADAPAPSTPSTPAIRSTSSVPSDPRIQFASTTHDFGRIQGGATVKCEFVFTNTGGRTLEVTNVHPSCGCTTAGQWSRQVEPGKTGSIPLQFHSSGSGPIIKTVLVSCNDPVQPTMTLQLKGQVWQPIEATPSMAVLNLTPEAPSNAAIVRLVSHLDQPVAIFDVESKNPAFAAELRTNQPGKEYQVLIRTVPPFPTNLVQGQITMKTSSREMPVLNVTAWANVLQRGTAAVRAGTNNAALPRPGAR